MTRTTSAARTARAAVALVAALALTSCAQQPDLAWSAAGPLQQQVLAVSTASAEGDLDQAVKKLDLLEKQLDDALAAHEVSPERYRQIKAALDRVRADLQKAIADAEAKAKAEAEEKAAAEEKARQEALDAKLKKLQEEAAAAQRAAEEAAQQNDSGSSGSSDSGGGNDKPGPGGGKDKPGGGGKDKPGPGGGGKGKDK